MADVALEPPDLGGTCVPSIAMAATCRGARAIPPSWPRRRRSGWTPANFHYALPAMASYLCTMAAEFGIGSSPDEALRRALFYYNHARSVAYDPSDAYVLGFALRVGAGQGGPLSGLLSKTSEPAG